MFNKPIICPVLLGRQDEVARLYALIDQALKGHGQLVLISGEAGIGKSRLAAEVIAQAPSHEFVTLQGSCFPTDLFAPYALVLDPFGSVQAQELYARSTISLQPHTRELLLLNPGFVPLLSGQTALRPLDPEQGAGFSAR